MKRVAVLPSLVTTGSIVCGFASIGYTAKSQFELAAWFIFFAMICDALDGKIARMTKGASEFGAQLDSLADVISFGLAPAFIVMRMLEHFPPKIGWVISVLFVVCAALRLARFNVETDADEDSHRYFKGLPSPAAAGLVASMVLMHNDLMEDYDIDIVPRLLPLVALAAGTLMISRVRYLHVLQHVFDKPKPFAFLAQVVFLGIFVALTKEYSLFAVFGLYAASGVLGLAKAPAEAEADDKELEEEEDASYL